MITIPNLKSFGRRIEEFAASVGVETTLVVKKLSFDIFADVVAGTPVDTGRAMNNWTIAVGSPDTSIQEQGGSPSNLQGSKKGEAAAALSVLTPFSTVWISNSLPYIVELEEGTSQQAPNGWVARAIQNHLGQLARFG